jgi:L-lactate dehydrogenase complex protein LldG
MVARSRGRVVIAREEMLEKIRAAITDVPAGESTAWDVATDVDPPAAYSRWGETDPGALSELFVERCASYRATVVRCPGDPEAIAAAVGEAFARHQADSLVLAPGLNPGWVPSGIPVRTDEPPLSMAELDGAVAALTGCARAIALTGTIVLAGDADQGRRALTLVPDVHICVVRAERIVFGVPEAIRALEPSVRDARRPVTLISGPSATSDIELNRVEGVHGPRQLEVVVAG